jgi:4-amino-4-deoxy-L-arabinose transferase-like glycosyltransferase
MVFSKRFWRQYKTEILLFGLYFGIRFLYSLFLSIKFGEHSFISYLDATVFLREAKNLIDHGVMSQFSDPPFLPDPLRTPLYLWFLAGLLWLGFSLFGVVTFQNILAGLAGILIYKIGKTLFPNSGIGILAAVIFAFEPAFIYWSNLLMSDNLFFVLLILAIYLLMRERYYWLSIVLALATLTRPVGLYFFSFFLIAAAGWFNSINWRLALKRILIMIFIFFILIFPWMLRNKILFNSWELSTAGWLNLYLFTVKEFAAQRNIEMPMPAVPDDYHPAPYKWVMYNYEFSSAKFFKEKTLELVAKFPLEYFQFHIFSGLRGLANHDYDYIWKYVLQAERPQFSDRLGRALVNIGQIFWLIMYAGTALGLFFKPARVQRLFLIGLLLINAVLIGYNGVISSGGRYNLLFMPFILLMGIYGLFESYKWVCARLTASISETKV